jgi:class 3 adenylate cyclase/phage shock protein PspC (stress-responsive transcriptional regulator)/predicted membrane protein
MVTTLRHNTIEGSTTRALPATFLFVDIARFTALTEEHGDETAADLAARLRTEVEALLPTDDAAIIKTIGDAVMVRMADSAQAVAIGLRIASKMFAQPDLPAVRLGMHHGASVERLGDFYGASVNLAARVADLAGENEVLVTEPLKRAAETLHGVELEDRGEQLLRHVASPVRIYAAKPTGTTRSAGPGESSEIGDSGQLPQDPGGGGGDEPPAHGSGGNGGNEGSGEGVRSGDGDSHPRRLFRSRSNRVIAGVAGGLGRYFNIDPIIFRILLVALALFGGVGVLLYLAAWLFVPQERVPGELEPARGATGRRAIALTGIVLLLIAALILLYKLLSVAFTESWPIIAALLTPALIALAAGGAWLRLRGRAARPGRVASPDAVIARRIAFGIWVVAALTTLALGSALAAGSGGATTIAVIVIALGVALVLSASSKRARWLIAPAVTIAVAAGVMVGARVDVRGGVGERDYHPLSLGQLHPSYRLGMGRLELDLRGVQFPAGDYALNVKLGIGEVDIIVPRNVCVATNARVGIGYVGSLDRETGGVEVDWHNQPVPPPQVPRLVIHSDIGIGALRVADHPIEQNGGFGEEGYGGAQAYGTNNACFESKAATGKEG